MDAFQDANICKCGCKYMHPGLQTFASGTESIENTTLNLWISMRKELQTEAFPRANSKQKGCDDCF